MGTKEKCAAGLLLIGDLCPLPADAAGDVGDLHALGLQLIADTVGLGEVFGLLGVGPGPDQGLHLGILAAVLADHGEAAGWVLRRDAAFSVSFRPSTWSKLSRAASLVASVVLAFSTS